MLRAEPASNGVGQGALCSAFHFDVLTTLLLRCFLTHGHIFSCWFCSPARIVAPPLLSFISLLGQVEMEAGFGGNTANVFSTQINHGRGRPPSITFQSCSWTLALVLHEPAFFCFFCTGATGIRLEDCQTRSLTAHPAKHDNTTSSVTISPAEHAANQQLGSCRISDPARLKAR